MKPRKVLVLGSGALKIGEAGEFDYSGSQAIKALREEGLTTVLVNPNIATVQTSSHLADHLYLLPVTPEFVEPVIAKERPDALLCTFGGQTALNCALELDDHGVLDRYGVRVLGTSLDTIRTTEDRDLFARALQAIGVEVPRSIAVSTTKMAERAAATIGYPVMLRAAYALGGLGSGVARDAIELREKAQRTLTLSRQVLVEEYLAGWKEIEYEVIRDRFDNCVTVCNMENVDPMGIHTGESLVVAPSQTLSNRDYHRLREIAIRVVRHLGVVGECNIQFALDPGSMTCRVIEVNARLSRSSALASKATGYPLALVAAQLTLGYSLTDLRNSLTGVTATCFEPALDYVVVKAPRWDLSKFRQVSHHLGSGMKSVGEVMAIGRKFEEALQKAFRMVDRRVSGLLDNDHVSFGDLGAELAQPTPERIFAIAQALREGYSIARVHELSSIDTWFLHKIQNIVEMHCHLSRADRPWSTDLLRAAKSLGFADRQLATLLHTDERSVRQARKDAGIVPHVKLVDTLAAEYPARSNYCYLTYNATTDDAVPPLERSALVLGSGPYSIGSSVEFDWCCVNTAHTLRELGHAAIVINHNPETVSTDYNESDRLYFEELSVETILAIAEREQPIGVIISMGGQIPNTLALPLAEHGVRILGTTAGSIDRAEDRRKFGELLDSLGVAQPPWARLVGMDEAMAFAARVGYPVLVRPSYVLSGAAMTVASNDSELARALRSAGVASGDHPVVITKFLENVQELEIDAVAAKGRIVASAISEHVENAGVHSGDATLVLPPQRTYPEVLRRVKIVASQIARALEINGPLNIQFLVKEHDVQVIECNLRASRSTPFVSKVLNLNFADLATRVILGHEVPTFNGALADIDFVGVKAPQFSFVRLDGADPTPGVEMTSTGEVGCLGEDFEEAFLKALVAVGYRLPIRSVLLSTGPVESKIAFMRSAALLRSLGIKLYATRGTWDGLRTNDIEAILLSWPLSDEAPNILDYLQRKQIDLVINIPKNAQELELTNDYMIRRKAVDMAIPVITNLQLAQRFVEAIARRGSRKPDIRSWAEYQATLVGPREPVSPVIETPVAATLSVNTAS